jgi:DNA gyrase inhibitor GyrI/ribosome-associated toxin RatA of RatAB toxin-antitoxin module
MWIAITMLILLTLLALAYLASLDGSYRVKRNRVILAAPEQVFAAIVDFKSWPQWSPWLMHETEAEVIYSENYQQEGGYYSWQGEFVGAGKLTHLSIKPGRSINQQIEFVRPFKSINQVNWNFESKDEGTLVSWEMVGSMPFFFRFMASQMEPMIGRDYELGLALLNGYMNTNAAHPQISFIGAENLDDFSYWAIPLVGSLRQLESARKSDIGVLEAAADGKAGLALTIYHQPDPLQSQYNVDIAISVDENTPHSNYTYRGFKGGRYFKMILHGDHEFLPMGWHALLSHCRMHKIKLDKTRPSLEIYQDSPAQCVHSNQVTTVLYIAIR